jgi:hypothetical protein
MTNSASNFMAIVFGLAVFAVIVAVGWRSVQNRRILRLQGANGQETIIVAGEDDDVSSVATETTQLAASVADPAVAAESEAGVNVEADLSGRDRLSRVVSSTK